MVNKIISGGQTGADQGGLFGARDAKVPTGGYAPADFLTEKGTRPMLLQQFGLVDSCQDYVGRTRLNAKWADITIWFGDPASPGGKATRKAAKDAGKIFVNVTGWSTDSIAHLIEVYDIVNVAGNRESKNPGICESTRKAVYEALMIIKTKQTTL